MSDPDLTPLVEAWAMETGLPIDILSDFFHYGFALTLDLDDMRKFANRAFAAGREAQREDDALAVEALDSGTGIPPRNWDVMWFNRKQWKFWTAYGWEWHHRLAIAAIRNPKPTEEDKR